MSDYTYVASDVFESSFLESVDRIGSIMLIYEKGTQCSPPTKMVHDTPTSTGCPHYARKYRSVARRWLWGVGEAGARAEGL